MKPPRDRLRTQWGAVTVAAVMLGLAAVYLGWRILAPGSCVLLFPTAAQWSESGPGPGVVGDCSPAARLASAWSTMLFVISLFLVSGYAFRPPPDRPGGGGAAAARLRFAGQHDGRRRRPTGTGRR